MVLERYTLYIRHQQYRETFDDLYCKLRRLYDLAEAAGMSEYDLLTVLITKGVRDRKTCSKIHEDFRTPNLDDTVKLIQKMVYIEI